MKRTLRNAVKNKNKRIEVTNSANKTKSLNSDFTLFIVTDLMKGNPEK